MAGAGHLRIAGGIFLVSDSLTAIHERRRIVALGDQLEPSVPADGFTVALVNRAWKYPLPFPKEWELTARLTLYWPQESANISGPLPGSSNRKMRR